MIGSWTFVAAYELSAISTSITEITIVTATSSLEVRMLLLLLFLLRFSRLGVLGYRWCYEGLYLLMERQLNLEGTDLSGIAIEETAELNCAHSFLSISSTKALCHGREIRLLCLPALIRQWSGNHIPRYSFGICASTYC